MKKLGLVARADNRGLGQQTWEFHRNMQPDKTIVIDCPSQKPLPLHLERFPDATVVRGFPTASMYRTWLDGLDTVYTAETPYHYGLFTIAAQMGIKTVLHTNPEFCDRVAREVPDPSLYLMPTSWLWDRMPDPKMLLPFPVATDRFAARPTWSTATRFLHIVGRPAIHDRNGTRDLLLALRHVRSSIEVTIRCQDHNYVSDLMEESNIRVPRNVDLIIHPGDVDNYWELYDREVTVLPRRFGGMSLPMQESCAAGMPVIAPDISPQNTWLPAEWLVRAQRSGGFMARTMINLYTVDHRALGEKIDQFATEEGFYRDAAEKARRIAHEISWDTLKPEYEKILR